jgi:hypothetical protein
VPLYPPTVVAIWKEILVIVVGTPGGVFTVTCRACRHMRELTAHQRDTGAFGRE